MGGQSQPGLTTMIFLFIAGLSPSSVVLMLGDRLESIGHVDHPCARKSPGRVTPYIRAVLHPHRDCVTLLTYEFWPVLTGRMVQDVIHYLRSCQLIV